MVLLLVAFLWVIRFNFSFAYDFCVCSVLGLKVNASVLSMVLNVIVYGLLLTDYPRARTSVVRFMFGYVSIVIILKFGFQLPVFCQDMAVQTEGGIATGQWFPSIQPWCPVCSTGNCSDVQVQTYWLGLNNPRVAFPAAMSFAQGNANAHPPIQWMHLFGIYKASTSYEAEFHQESNSSAFYFLLCLQLRFVMSLCCCGRLHLAPCALLCV